MISTPVASAARRYLPIVTVMVGAALVIMGVLLLAGRELFLLLPKPKRGAPTVRITSMLGYGVAFAIASLSCSIGPFLAVAGVALRRGDPVAYLAYALGMGLVVAVLAAAAALASTAVTAGVRPLLPYVGRVGGALLSSPASTSATTGSTSCASSTATRTRPIRSSTRRPAARACSPTG